MEQRDSGLSTVPVFEYGPPVQLAPHVIQEICFGFSQPPLGKGGFSTVYAGVYSQRHVAVKVLAIRNPGELSLFEAELGILLNAQLRHPHLLPLIAFCRERPALVMPQLKPMNRERLPRLPGSIRMKIAMDVAAGLAHLHDAGFVHNDMKPDNVLLEFDDQRRLIRALVGDLGCVKSMRVPVVPFGTILFMDPGLNTSGPPVLPKPADDVYSFGLTIVCIFTNAFPESQDHLRQMWASVDSGFPLISALARCMTNPNPALRPTCRQVARELGIIDNGWRETIEQRRRNEMAPAVQQQQIQVVQPHSPLLRPNPVQHQVMSAAPVPHVIQQPHSPVMRAPVQTHFHQPTGNMPQSPAQGRAVQIMPYPGQPEFRSGGPVVHMPPPQTMQPPNGPSQRQV